MQRPTSYETKHGKAILTYLKAGKDTFITAAKILEHLQEEQGAISRPTVYRQLDKLVASGKARKYSFGGSNVAYFQYIDPAESGQECYHMKCEDCDGVFNLKCDEVNHVSRHILEAHTFKVNDSKTVFYGKCKTCLQRYQIL